MHELEFLKDLVVVFAAGLVVVVLLGRLRVPPIAGYIVAGVLVGPGVLGLVAPQGASEEAGLLLPFAAALVTAVDGETDLGHRHPRCREPELRIVYQVADERH